jgi:hypothetical protein
MENPAEEIMEESSICNAESIIFGVIITVIMLFYTISN